MAGYFALFISIISSLAFTIVLILFKKRNSSDKVLEKSKIYMERMITNMNKNAIRDLDLINDNSKNLRELLLEAENTIQNFNEATDRLRRMIAESEKTNALTGDFLQTSSLSSLYTENEKKTKPVYKENKNVAPLKTVSQRNKEILQAKYGTTKTPVNPDAVYKVADEPEINSILKDETLVTSDGSAYKEVPIITTKVFEENPSSKNVINIRHAKKNLSERVNELYSLSFPVEEIAKQLNCSIIEVQTIIDLGV